MTAKRQASEILDCVIGADPGGSGTLWKINSKGEILYELRFKGKKRSEWREQIESSGILKGVIAVYMEAEHAMPGDFGPQLFTFGRNYERLISILEDFNVDIVYVDVGAWQRFHRLAGKINPKIRKKKHKEKADSLAPGFKFTQETADGYLIGMYGYWQIWGY